MKKYFLVILLLCVLFASCSVTEAPFEHKYVINLNLRLPMPWQKAYVDSTYRLDQSVNEELTGISGADIFVVDKDSNIFTFSESETTGTYLSDDSLWVRPNMTYIVNIAIKGDTISQEVIVPGSLHIYTPADFDTISLGNPPMLIWNNCSGCYKNNYYINAYPTGFADSIMFPMATSDTLLGIFYARQLFQETDTLYTVSVMGMDEHCYNASKGWGNFDEIDDERAIGVIGATVMDTIVVYVKE